MKKVIKKDDMANPARRIEDDELRRALWAALEDGAFALPEALRAIRALFGLSQVDFAVALGLSPNVVKSIESGRGNPSLSSLAQVAEFAGLKVALVKPSYEAGLFDPADRHADEDRLREADRLAVASGSESARERDRRNAMHIGEADIEWPSLA